MDARAFTALKPPATREGSSVNLLLLRLIEQGLGLQGIKARLRRHHGLDALAGSWSATDGLAFEQTSAPFGEIDGAIERCGPSTR